MELLYSLCVFVVPILLLALAFVVGRIVSTRHEADLLVREQQLQHVLIHDRNPTDFIVGPQPPIMLSTEVTIGIDHFRGFAGQLKSLIGGQVKSYQSVLERAKREVIARLKEQAHAMGYNAIANVRIDCADISGQATLKRKAGFVSILATGTGYYRNAPAPQTLMEKPPLDNAYRV